jgi:hypothetical protein
VALEPPLESAGSVDGNSGEEGLLDGGKICEVHRPRAHIGGPVGSRKSHGETGVGLTVRCDGLTHCLRAPTPAERGGAVPRFKPGEVSETCEGFIKGAGPGLISEAGTDAAAIGLAARSEATGDGVIVGAGLESMSRVSGDGVTTGVAFRGISRGGDGAIAGIESEAT